MSVCTSVCMSVSIFIHLYVHQYICTSVCPFIHPLYALPYIFTVQLSRQAILLNWMNLAESC